MHSTEPYYFPSHFNGLDNKKKLIFALQVMCIKSGFYLIQRSTKSTKQLQSDLNAYITLGCQHNLMYCTSKKAFVRSTFTKLCTNPDQRCRFSLNIVLCKITNRWFTSNKSHKKKQNLLIHNGHIKLLPGHITCSISMLSEEEQELMSQCNQVSIKSTKIAELTTQRNKHGTDTIWSRNQIYYVQNREDPLSLLNSNVSSASKVIEYCRSDSDINYLYMTFDSTNKLTLLTGKNE